MSKSRNKIFFIVTLGLILLLALLNSEKTFQSKPQVSSKVSTDIPAKLRPSELSAQNLSSPASIKIEILTDVLATHNDNDPRLDNELRVLDANTKAEFRSAYKDLPQERRNDRGTIVFLYGRNLVDRDDFNFFKSVLEENACLSLENCKLRDAQSNEHESDALLNYPQLVVLESLENLMKANSPALSANKNALREVLLAGSRSEVSVVAQGSRALLKKIDETQ